MLGDGRFGDRKVFIASLWTTMLRMEADTGRTLTEGATLEHFKAWLLRSRLLTRDGTEDRRAASRALSSRPRRCDGSQDGCCERDRHRRRDVHFAIDPAAGIDEYAPRTREAP